LKRDLGVLESYAALIGILVGAGIFRVTGEAYARTGPSVVLGYVVLAPVVLATSLSYVVFLSTSLGSGPGAEYANLARTFGGRRVAFVGSWLKIVSYTGAAACLAVALADYLVEVARMSGLELETDRWRSPLAIASLLGFLAIHLWGVRWFGRIQVAMCVVLGISIAVLVLPGLPAIRAANFRPFLTDGWSGFGSALPPLFFAYAGFESLAHAAGEVRQSTSTLPRVFLRGILFTTLVFVSMSAVTQGVLSSQAMAASSAPMAEAAAVYLPAGASLLVAIGAVFAVATSLNATLFVPSRLMIVLAEDGLLPRTLGRVSSSRGTPGIGLCLTTLAAAMLVLSGQISLSLNLAVLALVLLYALQALALLLLPRMRPEVLREAKVRLSPAVMRAAALFSLLSMVGLAASQVLTDVRHISGTGIVERIRGQSLTGTELAIAWGALGMLVYLTSA
jgi:amino acid transporter